MEIMKKVQKIVAGDIREASRLIRNIEDGSAEAKAAVRRLFRLAGNAHVIGITGSPGAGKSTLIDGFIDCYRRMGKKVGVLAVDPTSPFTGGAILGDRIRMLRHAEDPQVFVRSLAARCALGGLSKSIGDAVHVLDAMGYDIILIETTGAGQQEVDIINYAQTIVVVAVPGMGDEIQALKAGILEIADLFVINKAHLSGAEKLQRDLMSILDMSPLSHGKWRPPIVRIGDVLDSAGYEKGLADLAGKVLSHRDSLMQCGMFDERRKRRIRHQLKEALASALLGPVIGILADTGEMECMIDKLVERECDAYSLCQDVAARYLRNCGQEPG